MFDMQNKKTFSLQLINYYIKHRERLNLAKNLNKICFEYTLETDKLWK